MRLFEEDVRKDIAVKFLGAAFNLTDHHQHAPIQLEYDKEKQEVKCKYLDSEDGDVIFNCHMDSVEAMIFDVVKQGYEWNK